MTDKHNRASQIADAVRAWLANDGDLLERSVDSTVADGLFPRHDVLHMVEQVRQTVTEPALKQWLERQVPLEQQEQQKQQDQQDQQERQDQLEQQQQEQQGQQLQQDRKFRNAPRGTAKKVLCLHAGNLPMVGLQDVIAVLLSGGIYHGKLSRNDPWLLDGLLRLLRERLPDRIGSWAVNLENLPATEADDVLFAGSQASVDAVRQRIGELNLARPDARFLPRTARLSMARIRKAQTGSASVWNDLAEAMLRYEGAGCRSVAVVVSDMELKDAAEPLSNAAEAFLRNNPPAGERLPVVRWWRSYLRSVGKKVHDIGTQIVVDDPEMTGREGIICWVKGYDNELIRMARRFGPQLQSVYFPDDAGVPAALSGVDEIRPEPLSVAQAPPIDWQPDGIDVLSWLTE